MPGPLVLLSVAPVLLPFSTTRFASPSADQQSIGTGNPYVVGSMGVPRTTPPTPPSESTRHDLPSLHCRKVGRCIVDLNGYLFSNVIYEDLGDVAASSNAKHISHTTGATNALRRHDRSESPLAARRPTVCRTYLCKRPRQTRTP